MKRDLPFSKMVDDHLIFPDWLTLGFCQALEDMAEDYRVSAVARSRFGFMRAYESCHGKPENMKTLLATDSRGKVLRHTWFDRRNAFVARHWAQAFDNDREFFSKKGDPDRWLLALIMWAWIPNMKSLEKELRDISEYSGKIWVSKR